MQWGRCAGRLGSFLCLAKQKRPPCGTSASNCTWVLEALPALPATMSEADRRASRFERAVLDLVESVTLAPRVGDVFDGAIVDVQRNDPRQGVVMEATWVRS